MRFRLEDLVSPFAPYPERTPPNTPLAFLVDTLAPFRIVLAASLALTLVGVGIEIWLIAYTSTLVDLLAAADPDQLWSRYGIEFILVAAVILFGRPLAQIARESLDDIAFRPNAEMLVRWRAHRHVLGQSVGWFRSEQSGRIAAQVRDLGASATGVAYSVVHTLVYVGAYIIGSVWLMAAIDPRLMIPLLVWIAAYFSLMAYVVPRLGRASEAFQQAFAGLTGLLVDSYANIDVLKLFSDPTSEDRETRARFEDTRQRFVAVQKLEVLINSAMMAMGSLLIVGLVGFTIVLWQTGDAPLGLIAAALALSFRITGMAEWMLDAVASLFSHLGSMRQSLGTIAQPHDVVDLPGAPDLVVSGGAITFTAISHHYGRDDGGLDRISLVIAPGEKIGLVGRSGTGKSTLVNLLLRFFDPESGTIAIDGQNIARVTQTSLRKAIAMVSQDGSLLNRSVRDNIAHGRTDLSDTDILAIAAKAEAAKFIATLRDSEGRTGLDAHVGERGVKLSGGQRQRIALARAMLKSAPILVLDEATSALDSEAEAAIQQTLATIMEAKTVIAIAHRLSTLARMDRILVLDEGRIAEAGTHADLIAKGGIYAGLWARQSGGFITDEDIDPMSH